jgi:hypothetical protein
MIEFVKKYGKSFVAVGAALVGAAGAALTGDSHINPGEWLNIVILTCGAAAVFAAPNVPGARYTKLVLAGITAAATAAASLVVDGISVTDAIQILAAVFGALGVHAAPYVPGTSITGSAPNAEPAMATAR